MDSFPIEQLEPKKLRFRIRVTPNAKRASIGGIHNDALRISVTEVPENGKANQSVIKALAKRLGVGKRDVQIVSGQTSRIKTVIVSGVSPDDARRLMGQ